MINKQLINTVSESKKYIAANVAFQWTALAANIVMIGAICSMFHKLYEKTATTSDLLLTAGIAAGAVVIRFFCTIMATRMGYLSSRAVKGKLRTMIYQKLLRLGTSYKERVQTSEVVQVAVEGVDQLEMYFAQYLPQFFYSMLAPFTLFAVICTINVPAAVVLLVCVPLIPAAIAAVQTWARKLLSKYWGQYTALGDTFLENLQGLTTLKIYQADEFKHQEMNEQSELFRKITMKVLTMQLNSITIMDFIAYGGAAAGMIVAVTQFQAGNIDLFGTLFIILLAADFFIPMRLLGSFFHVAMNGMAASDKIFRLLNEEEPEEKTVPMPENGTIRMNHVDFSYEKDRQILKQVSMEFPKGSFTAIVGESGCGKSTVAALLMGRNKGYTGTVTVGGQMLSEIAESSIMEQFTYISHNSYLFKGTVRENLKMGDFNASDEKMWKVLEQVKLAEFLKSERGLDTMLLEKASNFSGGQCQRLALARALLHDSQVYIFDEATSNIDVESENDIMELVQELAGIKTIILISHRLANVVHADRLYVMDAGRIVESGTHGEVLERDGHYAKLWNAQQELEHYGLEAENSRGETETCGQNQINDGYESESTRFESKNCGRKQGKYKQKLGNRRKECA